jgi:hypothetical protein
MHRVILRAELLELRIDLDRIHVLRPSCERRRHIVAVARADDEHILRWLVQPLVRELVRGPRDVLHPLMRDPVHVDKARLWVELDPVVLRPERHPGGRAQHGDQDDGGGGNDVECAGAPGQEEE